MKKYSLIAITMLILFSMSWAQKPNVIIDADTGNEMDDLYAIVRAVLEENINVLAVTSAHFNNPQLLTDSLWHIYPTKDINTLQISQDLNEELLASMNINDIPAIAGCEQMVGYAWGYYEGAPIPKSPATEFIIKKAKKHTPTNKLNIIVLGPVTNVASAILQAPEIAKNIRVYCLTMKYNNKVWNKNSFNARNDINGLDLILNNNDLETWIIPGNVSGTLRFDHEKTVKKLEKIDSETARILERRWAEVSAGKEWIMWDLAIVTAFIHPEYATVVERPKPPENSDGTVKVYIEIDKDKMIEDFWDNYLKFEDDRE